MVIIAHGLMFHARSSDISKTRIIGKFYAWSICAVATIFILLTPRLPTLRSLSDYNQLLFFLYFLFLLLVLPLIINGSLRGSGHPYLNAEETYRSNDKMPTVGNAVTVTSKFVRRSSANGRTRVVFPLAAAYYYWMWIFFALGAAYFTNAVSIPPLVLFLSTVILIGLAASHWSTILEIRRAMKSASITASGSKYSFSNPLTYDWTEERERTMSTDSGILFDEDRSWLPAAPRLLNYRQATVFVSSHSHLAKYSCVM